MRKGSSTRIPKEQSESLPTHSEEVAPTVSSAPQMERKSKPFKNQRNPRAKPYQPSKKVPMPLPRKSTDVVANPPLQRQRGEIKKKPKNSQRSEPYTLRNKNPGNSTTSTNEERASFPDSPEF